MPAPARNLTQKKPRIRIPDPSPHEEDWVHLTSDSLHDLSSPVNQMCSLSDLILKKYQGALDDEAQVLFGFLQSSAKRMKNLLGGLRTYMRVAGSPPECRLSDGNALLAAALAMLQHTIDQSEASITHDALPELWCDPNQVTYVFASLIENSIKFRGERRPEIDVRAFPDKRTWVFSVHDNGMGIDPRYATRIFATFKRIHSDTYPGSGTGLAIAKRVIEGHRGRIWVESEAEQGATFFFTLPKVAQRDARSAR